MKNEFAIGDRVKETTPTFVSPFVGRVIGVRSLPSANPLFDDITYVVEWEMYENGEPLYSAPFIADHTADKLTRI